eukprot:g9827.t1
MTPKCRASFSDKFAGSCPLDVRYSAIPEDRLCGANSGQQHCERFSTWDTGTFAYGELTHNGETTGEGIQAYRNPKNFQEYPGSGACAYQGPFYYQPNPNWFPGRSWCRKACDRAEHCTHYAHGESQNVHHCLLFNSCASAAPGSATSSSDLDDGRWLQPLAIPQVYKCVRQDCQRAKFTCPSTHVKKSDYNTHPCSTYSCSYCKSCNSEYGLANNYPGAGEKSCVRTCASVCDDIVGGVYYVRNGKELCETSNFAHSDDANKCRDYCCDRGCKWPAVGNYNRARISVNNVHGGAPTIEEWQHWLWNIPGTSQWVKGSPQATCAAGFADQPGFAGGAKKLKCEAGKALELGGCVMRCTHSDVKSCPGPGSFKYSATDNRLCGGMACARDSQGKLITTHNDYEACCYSCVCSHGTRDNSSCPGKDKQFCSSSCDSGYALRPGYPNSGEKSCFPKCSSVNCATKSPLLGYAGLVWSQILTSPALNPNANTNWQSNGSWQCDSGYSGAPQIRCAAGGAVAGARNCAPICVCDHGTATQSNCPWSGAQWCASCNDGYKRMDKAGGGIECRRKCWNVCHHHAEGSGENSVYYILKSSKETAACSIPGADPGGCVSECCDRGCKMPATANKATIDADAGRWKTWLWQIRPGGTSWSVGVPEAKCAQNYEERQTAKLRCDAADHRLSVRGCFQKCAHPGVSCPTGSFKEVCRKPSGSNLHGYGHLDWPAILRSSQFYPNTNMGWQTQTQAGWVCDSGYHPAPGASNVKIRCLGAGQEAKVTGCAATCVCTHGTATQSNCPWSGAQWCASCNTNYAIRGSWPGNGQRGCYPSCNSVTCTALHEESSSTSAAEVSAASPFSPMTAAGKKRRLMNRGQSLASSSDLSAQGARRAKRGAGIKKGGARRKSAFARLSNSIEAPADDVHRSARTSTQDAAEDNLSHISDYEFLEKSADEKPDDEEDEAGAFEFLQTGSVSLTHQSRKQSSSTKYFQAKANAVYCSSATYNRQNCINACCQEVCGLPDATDMNLGYANIDWAAALTSTQLNPTVATNWQTNSNWQCDAGYHAAASGGPKLRCPSVGQPALVAGCDPTCVCTYGSATQLNCPFSGAQFCASCTLPAKYGVRTGYPAGDQKACFPLCSSVDCTTKSDSAGAFHQAKVNPTQQFCGGAQAANTNWQSNGSWQCDTGYSGAPQIRCGGAGTVAGARNCAPICVCDHGTATQASCPFSGAQFCQSQSCTSTHTSAYSTRTDYPSTGEKMCYPKCKLSDCAPLSGVHYIQNTETFCGDTKSTAFYTWSASTCRAKCCSEGCKEPTVAAKVGYDANIDYAALLSSTALLPDAESGWKTVSGHGFSCDATYVGTPRIKCVIAGQEAELDVSSTGCHTCVCKHGTHTNDDCPGHLKQFCRSCEVKYGRRFNSPAAGQVSCYPQCSSITCTQWSLTTSTQSYYQLADGAQWCGKWDWDQTNCFETCCEQGCSKPADGSSALVGYNQLNFKAALEDPLMNPVHPTHGGNWHSKSSWSCDPWYHGTAELKCSTAGQSVQLRGCMPTCLCWKGTPAQTNCPFSTAQFCQSCADPQRDGILVDAGSGQKRCWAQCSNITCHYKNANNAWYQNSIPSVSFCTGQNDTDAQCKNVCCEEGCREPSADAQVGYVIPSWEDALTKTKMYPGGSFQEDSNWSCAFQYHGTAKLRCTGSGNAALIDYSSKKVHCEGCFPTCICSHGTATQQNCPGPNLQMCATCSDPQTRAVRAFDDGQQLCYKTCANFQCEDVAGLYLITNTPQTTTWCGSQNADCETACCVQSCKIKKGGVSHFRGAIIWEEVRVVGYVTKTDAEWNDVRQRSDLYPGLYPDPNANWEDDIIQCDSPDYQEGPSVQVRCTREDFAAEVHGCIPVCYCDNGELDGMFTCAYPNLQNCRTGGCDDGYEEIEEYKTVSAGVSFLERKCLDYCREWTADPEKCRNEFGLGTGLDTPARTADSTSPPEWRVPGRTPKQCCTVGDFCGGVFLYETPVRDPDRPAAQADEWCLLEHLGAAKNVTLWQSIDVTVQAKAAYQCCRDAVTDQTHGNCEGWLKKHAQFDPAARDDFHVREAMSHVMWLNQKGPVKATHKAAAYTLDVCSWPACGFYGGPAAKLGHFYSMKEL